MARTRRKPRTPDGVTVLQSSPFKVVKPKGIDLDTLQSEHAVARSHLKAAETALLHAQEARERASLALDAAKRALTDGTRTVLG